METAEVQIIDDDEAVRLSLGFLLRTAGITSRGYDSAQRFMETIDNIAPGCVITDVRMPGMGGLELVKTLKEKGLPHPIIVITGHGDVALAVEAMKAGAVDFIEKPFESETLLAAVRGALAAGGRTSEEDGHKRRYRELLQALSPREQDVLEGVVAGKSNKVIAYDLGISPRTVEVHRANMMLKTGAGSLSELVRMALLAA